MSIAKLVGLSVVIACALVSTNIKAEDSDLMVCSVAVDYKLSNVTRLKYEKEFEVGIDSPFTDNFSTATRIRYFDASMVIDGGKPVVSINFNADVSVFNGVGFTASLKVRDDHDGETTMGSNSFYSSVPGAAGTHRTDYVLMCKRSKF